MFIFHFTGHASSIPDWNGDQSDLREEITWLQNFDPCDTASHISDDLRLTLTQAVPEGLHVLIIKDISYTIDSA